MKIYKVVDRNSGNCLESCFAFGAAKVVYKINEWVSAPFWLQKKGYHLIAFTKLIKAKSYVGCSKHSWDVYLAEGKDQIYFLPPFADINGISMFGRVDKLIQGWPSGTKMFKQIKLIKKVYPK